MKFTQEDFEAAFATIPPESLAQSSWLWRVNTWEKVVEQGAVQAAFLRLWCAYADLRKLAPEFHDWLLEVFPANEDQRILEAHAEQRRTRVIKRRRFSGVNQ